MAFNILVKFFAVQEPVVFQTFGLGGCIEIFKLYLVGRFFIKIQEFREVLLNLLLFFLVERLLLFIQIVDYEKILGDRTAISIDRYEEILEAGEKADLNNETVSDPARWQVDGPFLYLGTKDHIRRYQDR